MVSSNGVSVRHLSLFNVSRSDPLNRLPPDFVTTLTTPPPKRPYSAEMPEVAMLVSCTASSMYRSYAWPRRFSLTLTPFTMYSVSNDIAPAIEYAPLGPVGCTAGASSSEALMSRVVGSIAIRSCLKLVATCAVRVSTSAVCPTTLTVSVSDATPSVTSSGTTCVGASVTVFC